MKRLLIAVAFLGIVAFASAGKPSDPPKPHWQDMGVLHLYDAACPQGYDYHDYQGFSGVVTLEANTLYFQSQITSYETPTINPGGTCMARSLAKP